ASVEVALERAEGQAPEGAVRVAVQRDRVAGGLDLVAQAACAADLLADEEERRGDTVLAQQLEDLGGRLSVWPVVEGQVRAGGGQRRLDAERVRQPRQMRSGQRERVRCRCAGGDGDRGAHACSV